MKVKKGELDATAGSLATYSRSGDASPAVITKTERPVAALVLSGNTDRETVALSNDAEFLQLIQTSRARQAEDGGLSTAEVRRILEGEPQRRQRRKVVE